MHVTAPSAIPPTAPTKESTAWEVGLCACCLSELNPRAVGRAHAAFCSDFCKRRSADVRYDRRALRDNRIVEDLLAGDRMTALVVYHQHINFYALDLAYVRPRVG